MRKLNRSTEEPACLQNYAHNPPWGRSSPKRPDRRLIWESIDQMQKGLCCYCEKKAQYKNNGSIEHFYPKGLDHYKQLTYRWDNLFGTCGLKSSNTCGHFKGNYDPTDVLIKPDSDEPSDFFSFSGSGEIFSKRGISANDKIRAEKTIEVLRLDYGPLREQRENAISEFKREYVAIFDVYSDNADILEKELMALADRIKDREYQTAILYVLELI